jgi:type I restriction enzyme S subunit
MIEQKTIGHYLKQVKREVRLEDGKEYKLLGVKWYGQGMFLREIKKGKEIKADKLYQVKEGDFVYNRLFAWKSSFAIVEKEFDGCLVSNEFPTFEYNQKEIDPYFLINFILQPNFIEQVNKASGGMSSISRKRYKEELFINTFVPSIAFQIQKNISSSIRIKKELFNHIGSELANQLSLLKDLRQAILQEAIEGKLTADWRKKNPVRKGDPEYDAAALLEKIKVEKERLIKEGKIRKEKPLAPIKEEEKPFELPEGWVWCRLGEIAEGFQYGSSSKSLKIGKIPVLRMGNIQSGKIDWTELVFTNDNKEIYKYSLKIGDLLFNRTNSRELVGKTAIFNGEQSAIFAGYLVRFSMLNKIVPEYSNFVMNSKLHRDWCDEFKTDALGQSNLNATKLRDFRFPLPPLAEQHTIISRINYLLSTLDSLEKQITERQTQSEQLMQVVLREAFEVAA